MARFVLDANFAEGLCVRAEGYVGAAVALHALDRVFRGQVEGSHAEGFGDAVAVAAAAAVLRPAALASGVAAARGARAGAGLMSQPAHLLLRHRRVHHCRHRVLQYKPQLYTFSPWQAMYSQHQS